MKHRKFLLALAFVIGTLSGFLVVKSLRGKRVGIFPTEAMVINDTMEPVTNRRQGFLRSIRKGLYQ